jgi:hypothetical protein
MQKAIIIRGRLTDSRNIVLDEPLNELCGAVEITIRPLASRVNIRRKDLVDVIASLLGGTRTMTDIGDIRDISDQTVERPMWGHR